MTPADEYTVTFEDLEAEGPLCVARATPSAKDPHRRHQLHQCPFNTVFKC